VKGVAKYVSASVCHAEIAVLNPPKASTTESCRNFEPRGSFADRLWMGDATARKLTRTGAPNHSGIRGST